MLKINVEDLIRGERTNLLRDVLKI